MNNDHTTKLSATDLLAALQELKGIKFEVTVGIASQDNSAANSAQKNTTQIDITRTEELLPPVLTPKQIQKFMGISEKKTYEFLNSGELHVARVGRMLFVSRAVFLEWLEGKNDQTSK